MVRVKVTLLFWTTVVLSNALLLALVVRTMIQSRKIARDRRAAEVKAGFESRKEWIAFSTEDLLTKPGTETKIGAQ